MPELFREVNVLVKILSMSVAEQSVILVGSVKTGIKLWHKKDSKFT